MSYTYTADVTTVAPPRLTAGADVPSVLARAMLIRYSHSHRPNERRVGNQAYLSPCISSVPPFRPASGASLGRNEPPGPQNCLVAICHR